jgi:site-specific DNA recombinase
MTTAMTSRLRCAIYTRKSTEEGLDQEFNSLDAQREACEAFIMSQSSLGWKLVPQRYDDGGISGATMERPALQRLLQDIRERRVDVVVVYKIDRLTRSLSDFARIVEVFDQAQASFVSVTQQFNTTTSMGRLTLNVLLSFAQFEREVTAERIRDKIAASRQKGMWMGGGVPLGYRTENRKLRIDQQEAIIVRYLFTRYLELRSVMALMTDATAQGFPMRAPRHDKGDGQDSRRRDAEASPSEDHPTSTRRFGRGQLYHVLSNPIYVGKVRHRERIYDGEHEAIIDQETFARAQALLAEQAPRRQSDTNRTDLHLLTGILFDDHGTRLAPVHTRKASIRYRYYVSKHRQEGQTERQRSGWRLPARTVEEVVETELMRFLRDGRRLSEALQPVVASNEIATTLSNAASFEAHYEMLSIRQRRDLLARLIRRVELGEAMLTLRIDRIHLADQLIGREVLRQSIVDADRILTVDAHFSLRRRGIEAKLVLADPNSQQSGLDQGLVVLITRGHDYLRQLTDGAGRGFGELAAANNVDRSDFSRILRLAFLAPDIVDRIFNGTQPIEMTGHALLRLADLPHSWTQQRIVFGN